ncbi:protein casc4-like [Quercus lobata]|uniref:protein casc4-like n=1 Tax=Quercus lobata TaxID=97700 RepID=UPI00124409AE|nr:protein casc4-like [Quercus lobata]
MAMVTQQIFVAEEWAKKAREDLHNEAQSRRIAERAIGDLKKENDSLSHEVKEAKKGRDSAEAGLKNATKQANDMRLQLRQFEENLRTEKQAVSDLKAELTKVKGEARLAKEAAEKAVATFYERGVKDTEVRLAEEVATVCREYITLSWGVALDRAAVPADSNLKKAENIFFPEEVREIPDEVVTEEPLLRKALSSDSAMPETEDAQPAVKDKLPEDSLSIREVVAQAKETVSGPQPANG